MLTRRELLKGGGATVIGGLAVSRLGGVAGATPEEGELAGAVNPAMPRRRGPGPLYWSTYGYNNATNAAMPEDLWKTNVDWVAETFAPYGYRMVCTDGWCDKTTVVTEHGYIRSFQDDWTHDWAWWAKYLQVQRARVGCVLQPPVDDQVDGGRSVGDRGRTARHQSGRHRQPR